MLHQFCGKLWQHVVKFFHTHTNQLFHQCFVSARPAEESPTVSETSCLLHNFPVFGDMFQSSWQLVLNYDFYIERISLFIHTQWNIWVIWLFMFTVAQSWNMHLLAQRIQKNRNTIIHMGYRSTVVYWYSFSFYLPDAFIGKSANANIHTNLIHSFSLPH